ncbi:MAG: hypothetical protein M1833_003878 [Piccolia ochrophora]|nr:MAG: hypothetical protein M1833_003878 [Piccolia ochrophora]
MDAGGLAQMTFQNFHSNGALGIPGSGFASKGKGSHIKRLSMPPPKLETPSAHDQGNNNPAPTPRTSRSHLLAGLRTAPKSPAFPPSAPPNQLQHQVGLDGSRFAEHENVQPIPMAAPKTAVGNDFQKPMPQQRHSYAMNTLNNTPQLYSMPEQVLAPPAVSIGNGQGDEQMDPELYAELCATNMYLAQQQQRLQQQLINVTAAAQQFQGLSMNEQQSLGQPQYGATQMTPSMRFGNHMNNGMQPVITPVAGAQPGLYSIYNPSTGQQTLFFDPSAQQLPNVSSPCSSPEVRSPSSSNVPRYQPRVTPPPLSTSTPNNIPRTLSPPKVSASPPQDSPSLPPPSANAFRRGHNKAKSMISSVNTDASTPGGDTPKTSVPRSAGFPQTPLTGSFGPGQNRAGEHPVRQPRGPPPLEELKEKPTSKYEGGQNFATRRRRRAVHSLVRAGMERRGARGSASAGSAETMTPVSESEITFSFSSDNDSDSLGSGVLSGKPSLGSLRAAASGAIGSERKGFRSRSRERDSLDSQFTVSSFSSDDGPVNVGKPVEVTRDIPEFKGAGEVRKTPMLVLTSAEKRKTSMF